MALGWAAQCHAEGMERDAVIHGQAMKKSARRIPRGFQGFLGWAAAMTRGPQPRVA